jgi:DNA-directed RNA polymerase III subunit RPC2
MSIHIFISSKSITKKLSMDRFKDIRVKFPEAFDAQKGVGHELTPQECRLRDITYAGNIYVDIEYVRGRQIVSKKGIEIGRMPIMLRSCRCVLTNKSPEEMVKVNECPLDPGGYFIVRGVEKVILMQEQLSKNRIIIEYDRMNFIQAAVTSSTAEKKSKTYVVCGKGNKMLLRHNSLNTEVPIMIVMRALGVTSDKEIAEMICGDDKGIFALLAPTLQEGAMSQVFTQTQALEYIGGKVKMTMRTQRVGIKRDYAEEARELLANTVLAHIDVDEIQGQRNFKPKALYVATMIRRVLLAVKEGGIVDDRDFVGNKRIES